MLKPFSVLNMCMQIDFKTIRNNSRTKGFQVQTVANKQRPYATIQMYSINNVRSWIVL